MITPAQIPPEEVRRIASDPQGFGELTEPYRRELQIHYVVHMEEVLALALQPSAAQSHTGLPVDAELRETVQ